MAKKDLLYTNCWEDADVLLDALNPGAGDHVLSIGSAGDNSFSLLSKSPAQVIIYDSWLPQLHLIELKRAAFKCLGYADFLGFLGFEENNGSLHIYHKKISPQLTPAAKIFWDKNVQLIEKGVIHCGKLEHYFRLFRRYILPVMASKKDVDYFFAGAKTASDLAEYRRRLKNPFFHIILKLFLSEPVLKATGRRPAFFKEINLSLSKYLFDKLSAFILNPESYHNHYMYYAATGHFGKGLPHYAREENFEAIRANLERLVLRHGKLEEGLEKEPGTTLINASDIFEYMPIQDFKAFGERLSLHCPSLKRIAYWNFVVDRKLSEVRPSDFHLEEALSAALCEQDKVYFYKRFVVETTQQSTTTKWKT